MNKLSITSINNRAPLQVTTRNGAFEFFADSNPSYVEVLTAFNDFIKEFPEESKASVQKEVLRAVHKKGRFCGYEG